MFGTSKGFSLIELMVVILIVGAMATIFIPTMFQRRGAGVMQTFVTDLNAMVQVGVMEAQRTDLLHRVKFDLEKSQVMLEAAQKPDVDPTSTNVNFDPVYSAVAQTVISFADELTLRHFFIGKTDELSGGFKNKKVWFFIGPDGSVQDVTLVINNDQKRTISLITNPFSGQLVVYEGSQKP